MDVDGSGVSAVYRLLLTDALAWADGLRWTQEVGYAPLQPAPMCVHRVIHAYRQDRALQVAHDAFEIGDTAAAAAHAYQVDGSAQCTLLDDRFAGEPAHSRAAVACALESGAIHFRFSAADVPWPLRLRRSFDTGAGTPGVVAGSAGASVFVNGVIAGSFPATAANPLRRWQQQDAVLTVAAGTQWLDIDVVPDYSTHAPSFSQSRWELRGGWRDAIFANAFEGD